MKCYIIAGPTASGKSSFALNLSEKVDGSIVNGDSKQVYDILPTLTAQPSDLENHYLYGYFDHQKRIDLMIWLNDAVSTIKMLLAKNKTPIIVGGTGFYLKALQEGFVKIPNVEYKTEFDKLTDKELYEKVLKADPESKIKLQDRYRLIRSLNVMAGTGKPYSWWAKQEKTKLLDIEFHSIYISKNKEETYKSAFKRLDTMFPQSFEEVESFLKTSELNRNNKCLKHVQSIIGVEEITLFLQDEISEIEMKKRILIRTMQYAKQQRTWFKSQMFFNEITP